MHPKVSVIVPVFNVQKYLVRCINSLINQSLTNIEILLIDDGSTDNSGTICDEFAKKDNRIIVIHKENGGLSDARNVGLDNANGQYVGFVDSDDFIHKEMYSSLYNALICSDADIAESGYCEFYSIKSLKADVESNPTYSEIYSREKAVISTIMDHKCRTYVWNKLYKKELWDDIRFPYGKLFEDAFTTYKIINKISKLVRLDSKLYFYFQRENSIVSSNFSVKKLDHCDALYEMMQFIIKTYPEAAPITCIKYYQDTLSYLQKIIEHQKEIANSKLIIKKITNQMFEFIPYLRNNKDINKLFKKILNDNFNEYLIQRKRIKPKIFLLKTSIKTYCIIYLFSKSLRKK